MTDLSQEAHEALQAKAVSDAVAATEAALSRATDEKATAQTKVTDLETANTTLTADVTRLNGELDKAQIELKAAQDKVAELEKAAKDEKEAAEAAEVASKRTDQVKSLEIFEDQHVSDNAPRWAAMDEASWTAQVTEWQALKGRLTGKSGEAPSTETASVLKGSSDAGLTTEVTQDAAGAAGGDTKKPSARRAALGLGAKA